MKKLLLTVLAALAVSQSQSQNFACEVSKKWQEKPVAHPVLKKYDSSSAVGILQEKLIECVFEKETPFTYSTYHYIIKVQNDKGIEMYNKIYIPVSANAVITEIKARVITAAGKVIDLPSGKIKEIEEDGRLYKLFAMEGADSGSEIEYSYTVKKIFSPFGLEVFQSTSIPYQKANFSLTVPKHLYFDVKGYNGFKVSKDSVIGEKRITVGYDTEIDEVENEKYSVTTPHLKRVQYKLSYNLAANSDVRLYTWKEFAKRAFTAYTTCNSKETKALDNLAKQIDVSTAKNEAEKILLIEDYIKSNFNIDEKIMGDDAAALDKVVKTKNTNREGAVRIFTALFDRFQLDYQLVFPSNRSDFPIDETLENWNSTEDIFFWFPHTKKFIDPASTDLRYPFVPPYLAGGKGLFLKSTTIGDMKTAIGVFNTVPMEPFSQHAVNMEAEVRFNNTLDTLLISSRQILLGYGATNYRPVYNFLPKDKQDELSKEIIKRVGNSTNISNIKVQNAAFKDYFSNKPLIISGEIKSTEMVERAGSKMLLKIGEIIGPQEQMYQEKPRKLSIELVYPHLLERKITLEVPRGYTIKNLSDLNMNVSFTENDVVTMGFVSSYIQEENKIHVSVVETYRNLQYPLSQFENFKKVINAAADFNKIVLVLEKNKT